MTKDNGEFAKVNLTDLAPSLVDTIGWGMGERARLRVEADRIKEETDSINLVILPLMEQAHLGSVAAEGVGTLMRQSRESRTINRDLLVNAMLAKGWDTGDIKEVVEAGTTLSMSVSLVFRPPATKKGKDKG